MPNNIQDSERNRALWEERYQLLLQFVAREGHCRVPARHEESGFRLGKWVASQRQNRGRLISDRRRALEKVSGWFWKGQDAKWVRAFKLLKKFVKRERHALVPKKHIEGDFALGVWVMHQRDHYRRGELPRDREALLERIPGWVWYSKIAFKDVDGEREFPPQPHELANASIDELAEAIWTDLFGMGAVQESVAVGRSSGKLYEAGLITARHAPQGSPLSELIEEAIETGVAYDYLDRPQRGYIRAVIREPTNYESADWDYCLSAALDGPQERDELIQNTVIWAEDFLGLEIEELAPGDAVWSSLTKAIQRGMKRGEIKTVRGGRLAPSKKRR